MSTVAHNIEEKQRTEDVQLHENVDFTSMLLSDKILIGLQKCGFKKPSPIQLKAIPLGRCGFDLIVKAKSGTGKTAVFGVTALECVNLSNNCVQVLILAPTREIAVQIQNVITSIGSELQGLNVQYFIGGTPIQDDEKKLEKCHIAVGAPGRIKHLIDKNKLDVSQIKLFVLDEADKLLQNSYQTDINKIYHKLPTRKQMIAASATYPDDLDNFLTNYMVSPMHVSPDAKVPYLIGLKQFYTTVKFNPNVLQQMKIKNAILTKILSGISFNQCLIFSNFQSRAESLSNLLKQDGWPSLFIAGSQDQKTRLKIVDSLREFKCRILSSTDLTARGIDAANVDLVINYDVPHEVESYLHRMGRAGRYGSHGICITIASEGQDIEKLEKIIQTVGGNISVGKLPEELADIWNCDVNKLEKLISIPSIDDETTTSTKICLETSASTSSNIKTTPDVTNECNRVENEEFFEKVVGQLTNLLTMINKNNNEEGINKVSTILNIINKKTNEERKQFFETYKNMEAGDVLDGLKTGKISPNLEQDKKRIKLDNNPTLNKNLTLYTVTKCLSGEPSLEEKCIKCIDELLRIIKNDDETEKRKCDIRTLEEFKENHFKTIKTMENTELSYCKDFQCIDNQVYDAYSYAISCGTTPHWNTLCTEHEKIINRPNNIPEPKQNLLCNTDEEMDEEEYNEDYDGEAEYVEDSEYVDEEEYVDEDQEMYDDGNWREVESETNPLTWIPVEMDEIDENLIVDAYKNALKGEFCKTEVVEPENDSQPFGFAIDTSYSRKRFVNFTPKPTKKREKTPEKPKANQKNHLERPSTSNTTQSTSQIPFDPDLHEFFTRRTKYRQYFKHYSDVLMQTASNFNSVEEWNNWYKTWVQSLSTLREFVQQDVYEKEFRKKK